MLALLRQTMRLPSQSSANPTAKPSAMHRRQCLRFISCAATLPVLPGSLADAAELPSEVRIGLTPVFLDDQLNFLKRFRAYLTERLQLPVIFVQRGSYREIVELIRAGKIDFAWLCGYPYVRFKRELRLLAVPLYRGNPLYQSYLIVPAADRQTTSLFDLGGKMFAYSDPDSNSGYLYPQYQLLQARFNPATFFSRSFFTWSHRKVIEAVGVGLAQGGAVDGYVWDMLASVHPELTAATRIVSRSPELGYPPFVARGKVQPDLFTAMQQVLRSMNLDPQGAELLKVLQLDGFVEGRERLFDSIAEMARVVAKGHP